MPLPRRQSLEQLYAALQRYERLFQFRDPNNACLFDLRVNECYALDLIIEQGPIAVVPLAQALGIHKSNASRIARALERHGYIAQLADRDDRRSVLWTATALGREKHGAIRGYLVDRFESGLRDFKPDQIDAFIALLARLSEDAEQRIGERCGPPTD